MVHRTLWKKDPDRKGKDIMARQLKKLTVEVPADLLARATTASGEGVTTTVRRGLELVAVGGAYGRLRRFRGKVKFGVKISELRLD
jgi:hypothetical protein